MTKALTLHQPWASLVAVGAKTIETRSWSTRYRGPLLIHAGKTFDHSTYPTLTRHLFRDDEPGVPKVDSVPLLPLGAIVASCTLTDCVPIVDETGEHAAEVYKTIGGNGLAIQRLTGDGSRPEHVHTEWITDQLPFGDFSPGRYAWLLSDVKPTTERCPACWERRPGVGECLVCGVRGSCPPVPAKGRQGLWTWEGSSGE